MTFRQSEITEKEIKFAYNMWFFKNFPFQNEEKYLEPFLNDTVSICLNSKSWLKVCRESLQLSSSRVAKNLGITPQAYRLYELGEKNKTISLAKLAAAAEAMDCELIYVIRPKVRKRFSVIIWEKVLPKALRHPWLKSCDQKRKAFALCYIVTQLIRNPQFRKEQNWSQHKN